MLAVAWDSLESNSAAAVFIRLLSLSLLSPGWTKAKRLQWELQRSKLVCLNSSLCQLMVSLADTLLSAEASQSARHNQLIPTSPVAKKRSADGPIRTESTESVTDWTNRKGVVGFLPIQNTEAWEKTEILWYSQTTTFTNICLWVLWHFLNGTQKSYWCLPQSYQLQL